MKIYVFITYIYLLRSKNSDTKYCKFHKPSGSRLTHTIRKKKRKSFISKVICSLRKRKDSPFVSILRSVSFKRLSISQLNANYLSHKPECHILPFAFFSSPVLCFLNRASPIELIHTAHSHVPADTHPWASPLPLQSSYTNLRLWSSRGSPRAGLSPKHSTPSEHQVTSPWPAGESKPPAAPSLFHLFTRKSVQCWKQAPDYAPRWTQTPKQMHAQLKVSLTAFCLGCHQNQLVFPPNTHAAKGGNSD